MEEIEKDFDQFLKMFTWNYLQKHFIKADNLTVTKARRLRPRPRRWLPPSSRSTVCRRLRMICWPATPRRSSPTRSRVRRSTRNSTKMKVVEDVKSKIKVTEKAVSARISRNWPKEL